MRWGFKTLAKLSNRCAKKFRNLGGVSVWDAVTEADREQLLGRLPTVEIWGIGPRRARRLGGLGIRTMRDLRDADAVMLCNQFSIVMMRTVLELGGTPCAKPRF